MAIIADITIQDGITIPAAYVVIEHTSYLKVRMAPGEVHDADLSGVAYCYPDKASCGFHEKRFHRLEISKAIEHNKSHVEQLYEALKQHPQVSNAQDV